MAKESGPGTERIGLFGGSFDPIHLGHLISARAVVERLSLDRVIFLPTAAPPHKTAEALSDGRHRAEMIRRAIATETRFGLDLYDLMRSGPTYTLDTVRHFAETLPRGTKLFWIIGADSVPDLIKWHRVGDLLDACTVVTAVRPGWEAIDYAPLERLVGKERVERLKAHLVHTPRIDISATDIRARVRANRSVRYLVPDAVLEYIHEHGLYRA